MPPVAAALNEGEVDFLEIFLVERMLPIRTVAVYEE
jgi:hypothetical protein